MSRSEMDQFVKKFEKKRSDEPVGAGREIEVKPNDQPTSDKPSSSLGKIDRKSSFSSKSSREGNEAPKDQVRGNVEGLRVQVPSELRGPFEGYVKQLSRPRSAPSRKAQAQTKTP